MAAGDTDVSICSEALILLGQTAITSFDDGTAGAGAASKIYPKVKSSTLGMYPWTFTLAKVQLGQLAAAPTNVWELRLSITCTNAYWCTSKGFCF